ncbi:MAG: nitroreductase family protein [Treponema sp.]|nr:nitroreductase family protein [Treponema sp.]
MDFFEVIAQRYSHKEGFLPDPVPLEDLEKIAQAGLSAPTGGNSQCVKLIILKNREEVDALCQVAPTQGMRTAPAAIALLTQGKHTFEVEDYSAAAAQMLLAATALGYASLWLDGPYFDEDKQKGALKVLGAPEDCHLWVVLPLGRPDGPGSRRTKMSFQERVSYSKLGQPK